MGYELPLRIERDRLRDENEHLRAQRDQLAEALLLADYYSDFAARTQTPEEEATVEEAMKLAQKIASRPPLAVRYAKEAVNRSQEGGSASGFALESYLHALSCTTEDKKEGVSAFLEKRKGKFKGK